MLRLLASGSGFELWYNMVMKITLIIIIAMILILILGFTLDIFPTYQCSTSTGPNGVVEWCEWSRGVIS